MPDDGGDEGEDDGENGGERSLVWRLWTNDGDKRSEDIHQAGNADGNSGTDTNRRVDVQHKDAESREEEEEGHMQESRNCLCNNRHVPSFQVVVQVLSKSCTLQRVAVPLEDVHVFTDPLLDEDCEEGRGKTEDESHEPENVHADVGFRWFERRGWGRSGRDGDLWSNGEDLPRDLIEEGDILLEVIHHLVLGVDCQVLFAVDYECGKDSGK